MDLLTDIGNQIFAGMMTTMDAWMANPYAGGLALAIIILAALFMSELGQVISTAFSALIVWGIGLIVLGMYQGDPQWDFMTEIGSGWDALAGLDMLQFIVYFLIFTVLIGLINLVKGLISG